MKCSNKNIRYSNILEDSTDFFVWIAPQFLSHLQQCSIIAQTSFVFNVIFDYLRQHQLHVHYLIARQTSQYSQKLSFEQFLIVHQFLAHNQEPL